MELTNKEVVNAKQSLDKLCQEKIPVQTAWKLAKMTNKLDEIVNSFVKVRQRLFAQYKIKQEQRNGQVILTSEIEGGMEQFAKEFEELLNLTTEVVITKVKLPDTLEIEPVTLMALEKFVGV